jgi:hypothetical protein
MIQQRPGMFKPALVGGITAGVLTAVPLVNCFCCLWIIGGAMLAAYLFAKGSPTSLTPGDGAVLGILTGIVAAVADSIVSLPFETMNREFVQRFMDQFAQFAKEMPSGWERWLNQRAGGMSPAWFLLGLLASAVIYAAFGALGGVIGASMFSRKKAGPPQGAPDGTHPNPGNHQP